MGFQDYDNGWWNPNTPPDLMDPNWQDYQQGQNDRKKLLGMTPPGSPAPTSAPGGQTGPQLPPRPSPMPRKHMFIGVLGSLFAGPLGLFYASRTAGTLMLSAVGIAYLAATHGKLLVPDGAIGVAGARQGFVVANILVQPEDIWILSGLASVVLSALLIFLHNRRAAARDAANLSVWQQEADRILAARPAK